jgi:isoquinoline 1-oxidoreductase beta subunit
VLAWDHRIVGQSSPGSPFEAFMVKNGVDATTTEGMRDSPMRVPMRCRCTTPRSTCRCCGGARVGSTHTAYVMETLVDEVARAAGKDPVAYRMA